MALTACDDRMHADVLVVRERLTQGVDARQRHVRRVQRVHPALRDAAGVRRASDIADELGHHAVGGATNSQAALVRVRARMHHHRHVDVVEGAHAQQLLLAGQEFDPALRPQLQAFFDLDELLRGDGDERHSTGQRRHDPAVDQPKGDPQHGGDLRVVAAGVRRAGGGVMLRMLPRQQRVQLAQDGHGRSAGAALDNRFDAGQAQPGLTPQSQLSEPVRHDAGRPLLVVTQLRGGEEITPDSFDGVPTRVDRAAHGALQIHFHR
jgi:hypothetical protein